MCQVFEPSGAGKPTVKIGHRGRSVPTSYPGRVSDSSDPTPTSGPTPDGPRPGAGGRLASALAIYTLVRLGLVVVLAAVIYGVGFLAGVDVPVLVAAIFAVVIALPVGMIAFRSLRLRVNTAIAEVDEDRRRKREALQSRLRGEQGRGGQGATR